MSHIASVQCEMRDLEALKQACQDLGYTFLEGQQSYVWYGRWVGDTPMPEDCTLSDLGKCDHAIQVPGAHYTVGVVRVPTGWRLRFDYYAPGGLNKALGGPGAPVLKQAYAVAAATRQARLRGYAIKQHKLDNGHIKLVLQRG